MVICLLYIRISQSSIRKREGTMFIGEQHRGLYKDSCWFRSLDKVSYGVQFTSVYHATGNGVSLNDIKDFRGALGFDASSANQKQDEAGKGVKVASLGFSECMNYAPIYLCIDFVMSKRFKCAWSALEWCFRGMQKEKMQHNQEQAWSVRCHSRYV